MPRDDGRFDDLLSREDAERLVTSTGLRFPGFRLVKADEQLPVGAYTVDLPWRPRAFTGTVDVRSVVRGFERGATIVLQALHVTHAPLAAFCRSLEQELREPVQVNAYYTPRAAQGLPVHHDTHDVFVLQTSGEKRWLVYPPALELPLRTQRYRPDLGEPGQSVLDVTVRPGDTLYLPRGWLHEALTSESDSLHLTVGVNTHTWLDAFRAALDECTGELSFRRAANGDAAELVETLARRLRPEDVVRRREERLVRTRRPVLPDAFDQLRALEELDLGSAVERRPSVLARLAVADDDVVLEFEGARVRFPGHVRKDLEYAVRADRAFTAGELPGRLDEAGRLVLIRRLVREGFLRIVDY